MGKHINQTVLMSGAEYFGDDDAINAIMDSSIDVDVRKAIQEHESIIKALKKAGVTVKKVSAPVRCQDGVYTANWGLVRNGKVLLARLPNTRKPEEPYAAEILSDLGIRVHHLPVNVQRFSGQGDALPCGDTVFTQSPFRTTTDAHPYFKEILGFRTVVALQTKPVRWFGFGPAKRNKVTGWPDSPTYDIDLALAVIKGPGPHGAKPLIAYCPELFKKASQKILKDYKAADKIIVSKQEAMQGFALNLVSTGKTVVMNSGSPLFQAALETRGLKTIALDLPELRKGGGSIRCSTLTLEN